LSHVLDLAALVIQCHINADFLEISQRSLASDHCSQHPFLLG